jgi:hypothetical protein
LRWIRERDEPFAQFSQTVWLYENNAPPELMDTLNPVHQTGGAITDTPDALGPRWLYWRLLCLPPRP